jgi:hypothetical protein
MFYDLLKHKGVLTIEHLDLMFILQEVFVQTYHKIDFPAPAPPFSHKKEFGLSDQSA